MKTNVLIPTAAAVFAAAYVVCIKIRRLRDALEDEQSRKNRLALQLMSHRNQGMHSEASIERGRSFTPRASDVFVVTYPKCGTTWVTQICHALRTNASMEFGEITEVCPWDILALDCKQDLDADHVASPRVWKSHEAWGHVAKGGKYIYVARNPLDAFFSFYKFLPSFTGLQPGDIDTEAFAAAIFAGASVSGQIWDHFLGWYEQRHDANVLWVFFEDLASDLPAEVKRIARFMGVDATPTLLNKAARVSSFESMASKANKHHYDDHFIRKHIAAGMRLPADATHEVTKVNQGKVGASKRVIPPALKARLDAKCSRPSSPGPRAAPTIPRAFCAKVRAERKN